MVENAPQPSVGQAFQQHDDARDLNLLSIFYYILAGLQAFLGCCPIVHFIMGGTMAMRGVDRRKDEMVTVGVVMMVFAIVIIAVSWTLAFAKFLTARKLKKRESFTFCYVIAIITCLGFPFGTVLGVFTLIVLNRPGVKAMFEARKNQPYPEEQLEQWD